MIDEVMFNCAVDFDETALVTSTGSYFTNSIIKYDWNCFETDGNYTKESKHDGTKL